MTRRVVILLICLACSAAIVERSDRREATPIATPLSEFPMQLKEWRGVPEPPFSKAVLDVLHLSDYITRGYVTPQRSQVDLYVGYWKSQRQGETIHSPLNCLPGSGWEPVSRSVMTFPDPSNRAAIGVPVNRYVVEQGGQRELVLYWFQSHGRIVASEYWSKFYLIADAVRLNRTDGAIIRVIAPIRDDTPEAEQHAEGDARGFIAELMPKLGGFLPS